MSIKLNSIPYQTDLGCKQSYVQFLTLKINAWSAIFFPKDKCMEVLTGVKLTFPKMKRRKCMECPKIVKILDAQLLKFFQVSQL